jgi:DUF1365 family protein
MHNRLAPTQHRFHYSVFMFYIDLDELELLRKRFWLISVNRYNYYSFRDNEHLQPDPAQITSTRANIISYIRSQGITENISRVMLLTNLNILGYNFNPVSFYYCYDDAGSILCVVAEVGNTFRELKPYLIKKEQFREGAFIQSTPKYFYVSPFIDHDAHFDFRLAVPDEELNIRIDDSKEGKRFFISTLRGKKKAMTNGRLLLYAFRFPLITLKIISLIHWHALLLYLKKLPFHRKAANQDLQRDVYRRKHS